MHRIKELDSIRGLAALAIVFFHLWLTTVEHPGPAVDLFFVFSGYLITTIILKKSIRRSFLGQLLHAPGILRIWPIYYLTLLLA